MQNYIKVQNIIRILFVLLLMPTSLIVVADEMSVEDKIKSAMLAAPTRITLNASIVDRDGTLLRKGTNDWTCMPGGIKGSKSYPMCHDPVFMEWSRTVWKGKPFLTDVIGYSYMLAGGYAADINNPHAEKSDKGTNWHHEGPHMMLIQIGRAHV